MKKVIAISLVLALALLSLFACNNAGTASEAGGSDTSSVSESAASQSGSETSSQSILENPNIYTGSDYSGRTFTVLTSDVDTEALSEILWNDGEVNGETMPARVNEALQERQNKLKEVLGVELKEIYLYDSQRCGNTCLNTIRNAVDSGLNDFQVADISLYDCGTLSLEGMLYNLYDVENLDVSNPWWDQGFNSSVEMAGKLYFTTGDIDLRNKNSTTCILFNSSLCDKLGLDNPYDLALQYKWTLDKCLEMATSYTEDPDNDGITYKDGFGWAGQYDDMYSLLYGSGVRIVSADADGYPSLSFYNSKTDDVVTKVLNFMLKSDYYISGNDLFGKTDYLWPMEALLESFRSGKCLFFSGIVEPVFQLGDMQDEFGIVPTPMYDENQGKYYSLINTWGANSICIPISLDKADLPFVGAVLDVLGYYSWSEYPQSLAFSYYEVVLKSQKLTNEKGEKMLDLIFNSRGCELGAIYQVGKSGSSGGTVYDMLIEMMAADADGGLRSKYEEKEDIFKTSIENIINTFKNG